MTRVEELEGRCLQSANTPRKLMVGFFLGKYECVMAHMNESYRTKNLLESSGCSTRPPKTSGYHPRLTQMGGHQRVFSSELMIQIKLKVYTRSKTCIQEASWVGTRCFSGV